MERPHILIRNQIKSAVISVFAMILMPGFSLASPPTAECIARSMEETLLTGISQPPPLYTRLEEFERQMPDVDLSRFNKDDVEYLKRVFSRENLLVSTTQPSSLRAAVSEKGADFHFENAWSGHRSQGNNGVTARGYTEAIRYGLSFQEYQKIAPSKRPIYGYLQMKRVGDGSTGTIKVDQYGDDVWGFKNENLPFTVTIGDSFAYNGGDSVLKAKGMVESVGHLSVKENPTRDFGVEENSIHTRFLPYNDRTIRRLIAERLESASDIQSKNPALPFGSKAKKENYYELQIHGESSLAQVEWFAFRKYPPEGEFLKRLQKMKIQILDWRDPLISPKPWIPEESVFDGKGFAYKLDHKSQQELEALHLTSDQLDEVIRKWPLADTQSIALLGKALKLEQGKRLLEGVIEQAFLRRQSSFLQALDRAASQGWMKEQQMMEKLIELNMRHPNPLFVNTLLAKPELWVKNTDVLNTLRRSLLEQKSIYGYRAQLLGLIYKYMPVLPEEEILGLFRTMNDERTQELMKDIYQIVRARSPKLADQLTRIVEERAHPHGSPQQ